MVVRDGEVKALAPRFRIAVDFPDQKMMGEHSFMSIMESPQAIEKALTLAAGGSWSETPSSRGGFNF
jgi:hydrogenase maturation factor HypE